MRGGVMMDSDNKLTRIGVFYDGNFFAHVSNYYAYNHQRRARLGIHGLHNFIRAEVSTQESIDTRFCQIVDAHYFRGRLSAREAESRSVLLHERIFDDVLLREGVVTHYLPLGPSGEKGIDVWLALEVFELAVYKRFSVSVIISGDGDFVPLIRKLNTIGTRVMVLAWDFKFIGQDGKEHETRTAQQLLDEATYPVMMSDVIDDRARRHDPLVNGLFLSPRNSGVLSAVEPAEQLNDIEGSRGVVKALKEGYGFISPVSGETDMFFFHSDLQDVDFNDLEIGQDVMFEVGENERGACARRIRRIVDDGPRRTRGFGQ
jgi:cold shock CspA family protein